MLYSSGITTFGVSTTLAISTRPRSHLYNPYSSAETTKPSGSVVHAVNLGIAFSLRRRPRKSGSPKNKGASLHRKCGKYRISAIICLIPEHHPGPIRGKLKTGVIPGSHRGDQGEGVGENGNKLLLRSSDVSQRRR